MKMRFVIFFMWVVLLCSFAGCVEEKVIGLPFTKTFITGYLMPQDVVATEVDGKLRFSLNGEMVSYGEAFNILSQVHRDTAYNRYRVNVPCVAVGEALHGIKVETLEDFDAAHGAGSDISDLIEFRYVSFYNYVRRGYQCEKGGDAEHYSDFPAYYDFEGAEILGGRLSDMQEDDLMLIAPEFVLHFKGAPEKRGNYRFKLTIQLEKRSIETFFEYGDFKQ